MTLFEPFDEKALEALQKKHSCTFEVWRKDTGAMGCCGATAYGYATTPKKALCKECFEVVRSRIRGRVEQFHASARGL